MAISFCAALQTEQLHCSMATFLVLISLVAAVINAHICMTNGEPYIDLERFSTGDCVKVHYTAPTVRATIILIENKSVVQLHVDYRVNYLGMQNTVLLNPKFGTVWDPSTVELVEGITSTPGTVIKVLTCAKDDKTFAVYFNGMFLANYATDQTNTDRVKRVRFDGHEGDSQLLLMGMNFASNADEIEFNA